MVWKECTVMSLRYEFVKLATKPNANISELCRRYTISRATAYKWINRYTKNGLSGLYDQSKRPKKLRKIP